MTPPSWLMQSQQRAFSSALQHECNTRPHADNTDSQSTDSRQRWSKNWQAPKDLRVELHRATPTESHAGVSLATAYKPVTKTGGAYLFTL